MGRAGARAQNGLTVAPVGALGENRSQGELEGCPQTPQRAALRESQGRPQRRW